MSKTFVALAFASVFTLPSLVSAQELPDPSAKNCRGQANDFVNGEFFGIPGLIAQELEEAGFDDTASEIARSRNEVRQTQVKPYCDQQ
jgi:hypothetical protein